jgi:diadenosine tetraphosphate (Ap4A) HIT family hydrolase
MSLPTAPKESIVYENDFLYVCLALFPITNGNTIVVWKGGVVDLHNLNEKEYRYLMEIVEIVRDALLRVCYVEKVYVIYMDETREVHWQLVPRYNEEGFNIFKHEPLLTQDFSLAPLLKEAFFDILKTKHIHLPNQVHKLIS